MPHTVELVTNGNDSGPGSLRAAIAAAERRRWRRTLIRSCVDIVHLDSQLVAKKLRDTVISGGPTSVIGAGIELRECREILMQDWRWYPLWQYSQDPISIKGGRDITVEHCHLAFGSDQCGQVYQAHGLSGPLAENITFRRNIVSWEMINGSAFYLYGTTARLIENLFCHHNARPTFGHGVYQIAHNVFANYNKNHGALHHANTTNSGATYHTSTADVVRNLFVGASETGVRPMAAKGPRDGPDAGTLHSAANEFRPNWEAASVAEKEDPKIVYVDAPHTSITPGYWHNAIAYAGTRDRNSLEQFAVESVINSADLRTARFNDRALIDLKWDWHTDSFRDYPQHTPRITFGNMLPRDPELPTMMRLPLLRLDRPTTLRLTLRDERGTKHWERTDPYAEVPHNAPIPIQIPHAGIGQYARVDVDVDGQYDLRVITDWRPK